MGDSEGTLALVLANERRILIWFQKSAFRPGWLRNTECDQVQS